MLILQRIRSPVTYKSLVPTSFLFPPFSPFLSLPYNVLINTRSPKFHISHPLYFLISRPTLTSYSSFSFTLSLTSSSSFSTLCASTQISTYGAYPRVQSRIAKCNSTLPQVGFSCFNPNNVVWKKGSDSTQTFRYLPFGEPILGYH